MANNDTLTAFFEAPTDLTTSPGIAPSNGIHNVATEKRANCDNLTNKDADDADDAWFGCPWGKYKQYRKPDHSKRGYTSWIWKDGYRLQHIEDDRMLWVCKRCVQQKRSPPAEYQGKGGTANMSNHLRDKHLIDQNGPIKKRKHESFIKDGESAEQAHHNRRIEGFNPKQFKTSLVRWMAHCNIAYAQIETESFRRMMLNGRPELEQAGCLPCAKTAKEWIATDFHRFRDKAAEVLACVPYNLHFTIDLWTANNGLGLNGVFAHWLDEDGKKCKLLLSLPEIDESHAGENIAKGVEKIIRDWKLEDRIGYFVTDNASNNNSCIDSLGEKFNFRSTERRLRCICHILNLVAMAIMYSKDLEAFKNTEGFENIEDVAEQLKRWRDTGPLGKLHNVIMWITDKHADGQRLRIFGQLKDELDKNGLAPPQPIDRPTGKRQRRQHVSLKRPGDTRWNSHYFAYEAATDLRHVVDEFCFREARKHAQAVEQVAERNRIRGPDKKQIKDPEPPVPVTDTLSQYDWSVIVEYMMVLKPFMVATKKLEGSAKEGRDGMLWEVLPTFESLLHHLESKMSEHESLINQDSTRYDDEVDPFQHVRITIQQGWQKLQYYYQKLDETPIVIVAFVLHPAYRISKLKQLWSHHPEWVDQWLPKFQEIWRYYKQLDLGIQNRQTSLLSKQQTRQDFLAAFLEDDAEFLGPYDDPVQEQADPAAWLQRRRDINVEQDDEMAEFQEASDRSFTSVEDPIRFWIENRYRWPHVSRMALEIYGIPPSEADNERLYSQAGDMVTKKRGRLNANTIGAAQCLRQWDMDKIIDWR